MATGGDDARAPVYADLHGDQLVKQEEANRASAHLILSLLFELFRPRSVLDVGCGIGTWLAVAQKLGVKDIAGVDGEWLDRKLARISPERLQSIDLERQASDARSLQVASFEAVCGPKRQDRNSTTARSHGLRAVSS